jgi:two-component system, NtrC family, response regulator AtoC
VPEVAVAPSARTHSTLTERIEKIRLLVVSRDPAVLRLFWSIEESNAWRLETVASGWDAMERVQSDLTPQLLLLDIPRGDADSLHLLRWLRRLRPALAIVVLCYPDDAACGKEATRLGAEEILIRPFDGQQIEAAIRRHLGAAIQPAENDGPEVVREGVVRENVEPLGEGAFLVSASPAMQKLRTQAELLAQTDVPVLILGEAGTGKYAVASLIHKLSVRSGFKLHRVNCAEMPESPFESEVFGNGHASFADARLAGLEKFGAGEKATIFLDEIAALPAGPQHQLLKVLQNDDLRRSGDAGVPADLRILAASSANLERALAEKRILEDLYYRLSAFTVHVPPLRQRKDEIATLLNYFMHRLAKHFNLPRRAFTPNVLDACQQYSWPGNLTELEAFVKRYLVAGDHRLSLGEIALNPAADSGKAQVIWSRGASTAPEEKRLRLEQAEPESLKSLIQGIKSGAEQNAIGAALKKTGWNRKAAARLLRVSYRTLLYKIDQYQMRAPEPFLSTLAVDEFSVCGTDVEDNGEAN